jgi:hypothetical protein
MSTPGELLEALGREARARLGAGRDTATRVYRGRSVEELVPQIQRDLGADAIILRRREGLTGGMFGFFQRAFVEIEAMPGGPGVDLYDEAPGQEEPVAPPAPAALQYEPAPAPVPPLAPTPSVEPPYSPVAGYPHSATPPSAAVPTPPAPTPAPASPPPPPASVTPEAPAPIGQPEPEPAPYLQRPGTPGYEPYPPIRAVPERPAAPAPQSAIPEPFYSRAPAPPAAAGGSAYVTAHLAALARADRAKLPPRGSVPDARADPLGWAAEIPELAPREAPAPFPSPLTRAPAPKPSESAGERRVVAPGSNARARAGVARSLRRCGISEELAGELIDNASAHALALAPRAGLAQAVRTTHAQRIPVAPALPTKGAAIVLVGAGGAGKTTCCAALLGAYRKSSSLQASFATIMRDQAGVAEGEQGELRMLLSPSVMKPTPVRSPRALRALRKARGDGMSVVDTPSLSPSDRTGVRELAKLLGELSPERVVVALPATLGATAAAQLLQALRPLGANALALTHADETDQFGVAVEAACRFGLAPEYMLERSRGGGWRLRQLAPSELAERLLP